jgi:aminocarboxymuconate-semialdehyde decarboxylase
VHTHIFPKEYLAILERFGMLNRDPRTGASIVNESGEEFGYKYEVFEGMWDIPTRTKVMDKLGVDFEVLSIGNPWLSYIPKTHSADVARTLNKGLGSLAKSNQKRFGAMGVLPVTSQKVVEELDYAVSELEIKGFMIGTHASGRPIASEEFLQIFERAAQLQVPIYVHPLARSDISRYYDRVTATSLVFPTETAIFAKQAVKMRLLEKCPNLRIILAHLGGSVPFLLGRLDRAFASTGQTSASLSEDFKSFYLDSISYSRSALEYASKIWGADKIMLGTDYPHIWGDNLERTIEIISRSNLSEPEQQCIFGENATRLFKL